MTLELLRHSVSRFRMAWGRFVTRAMPESLHHLLWRNPLKPYTTELLDRAWYRARYPDVAASRMDPADHYYLFGAAEGRDPSALFDTRWYEAANADARHAQLNPLLHYLRHGRIEGRPTRDWWSAEAKPVAATSSASKGRHITFFHVGNAEFEIMEPLALRALQRGFSVTLSEDLQAKADIGVYGHHHPDPSNAAFSVVMLHDQGQDFWPFAQTDAENHWAMAPWDQFDIGILPGPIWAREWRRFARESYARPRIGAFELGWPKADRVFDDPTMFEQEVAQLRSTLGLKPRPTILHAPSWDSPDKQADFIAALGDLPVNLLLKYEPDHVLTPDQSTHGRGVYVVNPRVGINYCLSLADVLVSEESNCMVEGLLFGVPSVAVTDWHVPALPSMNLPARPPDPPDFALKAPRTDIRMAVEQALELRSGKGRRSLVAERDRWFSNLGRAAELTIGVIEAAIDGTQAPVEPLRPAAPGDAS